MHRHHRRDGYSSLERLNRKPRVNKYSREKLFSRRASLQTVTMSLRSEEKSSSLTRRCSRGSSSDEGDGDSFSDSAEFIRNRKERSTVLVRRFFKNNQKVSKCYIPFSVGLEVLRLFVVVMSVYPTLFLRPCPHVDGSFLTRSTPLCDYPVHKRVFDIISPPTMMQLQTLSQFHWTTGSHKRFLQVKKTFRACVVSLYFFGVSVTGS